MRTPEPVLAAVCWGLEYCTSTCTACLPLSEIGVIGMALAAARQGLTLPPYPGVAACKVGHTNNLPINDMRIVMLTVMLTVVPSIIGGLLHPPRSLIE